MQSTPEWSAPLTSWSACATTGARDFGLGLVERLSMLKRFFIREAAGLVGDVPKLLRGEAL